VQDDLREFFIEIALETRMTRDAMAPKFVVAKWVV